MAYEYEKKIALDLAYKAGELVKQAYYLPLMIQRKQDNTPVTQADLASNRLITEGLHAAFSNDAVISEEEELINGKNGREWYIDPIDGTRGFIEHTDQFAIHIGLAVGGMPVLGIVHKPLSSETYVGIADEGAYRLLPGQEQQLRADHAPHDRLIAAVQFKWNARYPELEGIGITGAVATGSEGLRVMAIVEGAADFRIGMAGSHSWDVCAPDAILRAAGGVTSYMDGSAVTYHAQREMGRNMLYSRSGAVHKYLLEKTYSGQLELFKR
jgi:3'(2'), 5'-bisphosphate nucleotidase